jgi:hypothetical protein
MSRRKTPRIKVREKEEGAAVGQAPARMVSTPTVGQSSHENLSRQPRVVVLLRAALFGILPVLFGLTGVAFVRLETGAIYLWDFATYWSQVLQLVNFLKRGGSIWELLKAVYNSTAVNDYNLLPSLPLVPFQWIGMDPRTGYIFGICLLYAGALYLVCCALFACFADGRWKAWAVWFGGGVVLSTATVWWPVFRGFVDVIALASALAGVVCAIKAESHKRPWTFYFLTGVFLSLAPVLRRSYSFYLLSFVALFTLWLLFRVARRLPDGMLAFRDYAPMGSVYLGIAVVFGVFNGFLMRSLKMDHGVHSSYKSAMPVWSEWSQLLEWFGLIPLSAALAGICVLIQAGRFRGAVALGVCASLLGAALQMRTATLGEHHRYILVAGFLIAIAASTAVAVADRRGPLKRVLLCLTLVSICGTVSDLHGAGSKGECFPGSRENVPGKENRNRPLWWLVLFGYAGPKPIVRNDLAELQKLYASLDRISATDPNPQIYLLSSGVVLGDGVIAASLMSPPGLKLQSVNRFLPVHQVDSRDGVPSSILNANYVLTTFPLDLHLEPESQKCVTVPWAQFRDGRGFARAFERMPEEFHLEKSVTAVLYRRTRLTTREDITELEADLLKSGLVKP